MENLILVYKHKEALRYIRENVDRVSHVITNIEKLEKEIFYQVSKYLALGKKSISQIRWIVNREISSALKKFGKQDKINFSNILEENDFGESLEFEPEDVLANVEEPILEKSSIRERIRSLAATDSEEFVLNAWIDEKSDSEIARELALRFGGNSRSLRIWVQRFRTKCQERLEEECLENNLLIKTA